MQTAAVVFSSISVFTIFSSSLQTFFQVTHYVESSTCCSTSLRVLNRKLTNAIDPSSYSDVSLQRINKFLTETPLIDRYDSTLVPGAINDDPDYLGFQKASFTWGKEDKEDAAARNFTLKIDSLKFPKGKVSIIAGPTGSGKTSLLMALLGEMHFASADVEGSNFSLPRSLGVSYASQQSWLLNETLRENILFGSSYNEQRYKKVVSQCALERDFTLFEAGDMTEVGGSSLSACSSFP